MPSLRISCPVQWGMQAQHILKEQVASYANALGSAEQRFSDLEAVVRRMAARTVAGL